MEHPNPILLMIIEIVALLIAIIGHEIMHGVGALLFGDRTAKIMGRLSPNPLVHIDPVGSIILPFLLYVTQKLAGVPNPILFGWAKPVPIDIRIVLKNGGYFGAIVVALAGIIYNLLLAFLSTGAVVMLGGDWGDILTLFFINLALVNLVLALVNLIPIPPIDGGRVLVYLLRWARLEQLAFQLEKIEPYGIVILLIFFMIPGLSDWLEWGVWKLFDLFITFWGG
ncbi:MAG: site-2 protease family protein [Epsilonproteobacteria bacterium]|jgi:Zn-dependent protease|nr:site-2 protease family protein [Campylobacterota bacterium]NPA88610.1 site-2 protease family protein [Campylobacterota bacterium]